LRVGSQLAYPGHCTRRYRQCQRSFLHSRLSLKIVHTNKNSIIFSSYTAGIQYLDMDPRNVHMLGVVSGHVPSRADWKYWHGRHSRPAIPHVADQQPGACSVRLTVSRTPMLGRGQCRVVREGMRQRKIHNTRRLDNLCTWKYHLSGSRSTYKDGVDSGPALRDIYQSYGSDKPPEISVKVHVAMVATGSYSRFNISTTPPIRLQGTLSLSHAAYQPACWGSPTHVSSCLRSAHEDNA
jgi:hypothetical protein